MAMERRILLFLDIPIWRKYLIEGKFNFSYGTRIHGNIISILSGIPALICACDSRTREMAEFFSIPIIMPENSEKTLEELYELADYRKFNSTFSKNFHLFEKFLKSNGLVKEIGRENIFFDQPIDLSYVNWVMGLLEPYRNTFETNMSKLKSYNHRINTFESMKRFIYKFIRTGY